jgi:monoamine oxidase
MSTIVIGAGVAGTFAARSLQERGEDVAVLEATPYIGGRTRGDRDALEYGAVADLGASFIDIGQDLLIQFCVENDIALSPRIQMFPKGPGSHFSGASIMLGNMVIDERKVPDDERRTLATEVQTALDAQPPTPVETMGAWARRVGLSPRAREAFVMQGAFNPVHRPDIVSSWHVHPGDIGRVCWVLPTGTDTLARVAAEGIEVQFETPVRLVTRQGRAYRVETDRGDFAADNVVVTSSIQATRRMGFDPVLPAWKIHALLGTPMAQGGKAVAQYRQRDVVRAGAGPSTMTNGAVSMFWLKDGPEDTVLALGTVADLGDGALVDHERTLADLDRHVEAMTGVTPERIAGIVQDWTSEEFTGGVVNLGTKGHAGRAALAAPVGGIHFAGEATGEWASAMEGAARSGLRVADEIRQRIRKGRSAVLA